VFDNWKGFMSLGPSIVAAAATWAVIAWFVRWVAM